MISIKNEFVQSKKAGRFIAALTAYDYPSARLLDESGLDLILVGDSLGMVVLGYPDTTEVSLEDMVHHTKAVARGVKKTLLVSDLPKDTYNDPIHALTNAKTLIEAGAHAVKLEGGAERAEIIQTLVQHNIAVLAHIGMLPQQIREEGGYQIKGRTPQQAEKLLKDSTAVEMAGAFGVVLELVTPPLAQIISKSLTIPTIGIGSGEYCDGQIRVLHDVIGLYPWFRPKFIEPKADVAEIIRKAVQAYTSEVQGKANLSID